MIVCSAQEETEAGSKPVLVSQSPTTPDTHTHLVGLGKLRLLGPQKRFSELPKPFFPLAGQNTSK